ncbi:uncharacterized protein Dwil_GK14996 [Drosophila willistoni]|uniref:Uncharacterized protein n=1 Tax=Drosophila willistoni TaxID=7260 RepID=B4MVU5_DROWI|nr:uncharacterized protein LOC6642006 [Drosophila willistoni]EDW75815.1 uncharacterized protein Dwil_GK14996 [Drosophila willistoni]
MTKQTKTPQKQNETQSNTSLTPVQFLDRQPSPSSINHDANLATCKSRLDILIKQLQDNYAKWQLAQQRGTAICYAIEAKKTKCLEKLDTEDQENVSCYPDDLILPCRKLAIIATIFIDIANNTKDCLRQLRALSKMPGAAGDTIFYRSWKLPQFVAFTKELSERYEQEALVKQKVMESIAHCMDRCDLIAETTQWEYPEHTDGYVKLGFLLLNEEVK